jgi:hypothetical protein
VSSCREKVRLARQALHDCVVDFIHSVGVTQLVRQNLAIDDNLKAEAESCKANQRTAAFLVQQQNDDEAATCKRNKLQRQANLLLGGSVAVDN